MDKEKKQDFVVTDRRKFYMDGEPRAEAEQPKPVEATPAPESVAAAPAPPAPEPEPAPSPAPTGTAPEQFVAEALSETGYNADKERLSFGGQKMEFIHLLDMLVQTAMMYAGAMDSGAERRVDVVGLRQMIDLIGILEQKTHGNLSEQEKAILTNTLFQLRMTYMEIVNMIDREAMQRAPGAPGAGQR